MENERCHGRSRSFDSTKSNISYKIISEDLNDETEKQTWRHVQPETWDKYFLGKHDVLKANGVTNAPCTRVTILSGTDVDAENDHTIDTLLSKETLRNKDLWKHDIDKITRLQSNPETNHMKFTVFDLGEYFHDFKNMSRDDHQREEKRVVQDIRKTYPTVIVFPFCAAKFLDQNTRLDKVKKMIRLDKCSKKGAKFDGMDGIVGADILKLLRKKPSLWQEPLFINEKCLLFKTKNIIQSSYTFLSSATRTTASGIEDSVPNLLDGIKLLGELEYISILFISGTHGSFDGLSGFSELSLLDRRFYEDTCNTSKVFRNFNIFHKQYIGFAMRKQPTCPQ